MDKNFTESELELLLTLVQKAMSAERKALRLYQKSPSYTNLDDPKADKSITRIVNLRFIEEKLAVQRQLFNLPSTSQQQEVAQTEFFVYLPNTKEPTRILCPECGNRVTRKPDDTPLAWALACDLFFTYHNACVLKHNTRTLNANVAPTPTQVEGNSKQ